MIQNELGDLTAIERRLDLPRFEGFRITAIVVEQDDPSLLKAGDGSSGNGPLIVLDPVHGVRRPHDHIEP